MPRPGLVKGNVLLYNQESQRVFETLKEFPPRVERLFLAEAFMNLLGTDWSISKDGRDQRPFIKIWNLGSGLQEMMVGGLLEHGTVLVNMVTHPGRSSLLRLLA